MTVDPLPRRIEFVAGPTLPPELEPLRLYGTRATAALLGLSPEALRWHRRHGSGPRFYRLGLLGVGYRLADIDAWLAARVVEQLQAPRPRGRPVKRR